MTKKFRVYISEHCSFSKIIEAKNEEEARDKGFIDFNMEDSMSLKSSWDFEDGEGTTVFDVEEYKENEKHWLDDEEVK